MMQMIATYDLQSAIDSAVTEEMSKQTAQNTESIDKLLAHLGKLLSDQNEIKKLWPNAPTNVDIFSNLNLEFDLKDGTVQAQTAARDSRGHPVYQYLFNLKNDA